MSILRSQSFNPEIDRQAAEWFGRREGGLSAEQEQEFRRWLAADERHAVHYGQFDETWALLGELKDRVTIGSARGSVAPFLAYGSDFRNRVAKGSYFTRRIWFATALAAAAIAFGFFLSPRPNAGGASYTFSTEIGGMRKLELPDGSVVRLNSDTAVEIDFTVRERRVSLQRGEAHFTVAKDSSRPFIVSAAGVSVRAVGTAFNVALTSASLEVLVTEGTVRIEEAAAKQSASPDPVDNLAVLTAHQKWMISLGSFSARSSAPAVVTLDPPELEQAVSWQVKLLEFDQRPLREVVGEFNRYNQHQLVIVDDELAQRAFGGTLRADNYEALVELLESRFGVIADRSSQRTVLRLRR